MVQTLGTPAHPGSVPGTANPMVRPLPAWFAETMAQRRDTAPEQGEGRSAVVVTVRVVPAGAATEEVAPAEVAVARRAIAAGTTARNRNDPRPAMSPSPGVFCR